MAGTKTGKETVVQDPKQQVYLKLEAIYEADVQVEPGKHVQSFLLYLVDIDGHEFMCPLTCEENFKEDMRKRLGRLKPLVITFNDPSTEKKEEGSGDIIDLTDQAEERKLNS